MDSKETGFPPQLRIILDESERAFLRSLKSEGKRPGAIISLAISILIAGGGYIFTWYIDHQNEQEQIYRDEIDRKIEVYDSITKAITNIRETRDEIVATCDYDPRTIKDPASQHEFNLRSIRSQYGLVKAAASTKFILGEEVSNKIIAFLALLGTIKNYCQAATPSQNALKEQEDDIKTAMAASILATQARLNAK